MAYTRKVQKIGQSLFISLPKTWAKQINLSQGDTVTLVEQPDGSLVLHSEAKRKKLKQTSLVVLTEEPVRSLRRRITGAYVDGFDLITLEAPEKFTSEQEETIRRIITELPGLEIVQSSSNIIMIQCLLTRTLPIEQMVQRIHAAIRSMFEEVIVALSEEEATRASGIVARTRDVKQLSLVLHRLLRSLILFPGEQTTEMKAIDSVDFLRVIDRLSEVSGRIRRIAETLTVWGHITLNPVTQKLLETCKGTMEIYDCSVKALMIKDVSLANTVLDKEAELDLEDPLNLLLKAGQDAQVSTSVFSYVHRIIDCLMHIIRCSVEIAEIAIDRAEEAQLRLG
ncbi:hypothetical protein B6U79_03475 [Candidatus Bathyarchaeota archaeon ex4484_231]|nr:MAG: hypothetical protein B6U79_03475 [Candidatus Bathyarchaeota archaeon ex4484_231]